MSKILNNNLPFKVRDKERKKDKVTLYGIFAPVNEDDIHNMNIIKNKIGDDLINEEAKNNSGQLCQLVYLAYDKNEIEQFLLHAAILTSPGHFEGWARLHGYSEKDDVLHLPKAQEEYIENNYDFIKDNLPDYFVTPMDFDLNTITTAIRSFYGCLSKKNIIGNNDETSKQEDNIFRDNLHLAIFEVLSTCSIDDVLKMKQDIDRAVLDQAKGAKYH